MQGWSSRALGRDDVRFAMEPRTFTGFLVAIAAVCVVLGALIAVLVMKLSM